MRQYRERRNARSTAAGRHAGSIFVPVRRRTAVRAAMALAVLAALSACAQSEEPSSPEPILALPESVLLAEHAPPFYSLQESAAGGQWIAVYADAADLTLRLARGSLAAPRPDADEVVTIDRVDLVPGINPYFGRHAFLQHDGIEHLLYTDQELADARVTKWIHRPVDSAEPWTVDLLPEPVVPVGVLPGPASDFEPAGFTLFGLLGEQDDEAIRSFDVRPALLEEQSAPIHAGDRSLPADAAPTGAVDAPGPALSPYHCGGRHGFSMFDHVGLLVVEDGRGNLRVELPGRAPELPPPPLSVACGSQELLVVTYVRDDRTALESSDGAARGAHEVVAVTVDHGGAVGNERKITLAREVHALAAFPDRGETDAVAPALTVLFSELALGDSGEPEYHLSLVTPGAEGAYRKLILARGSEPVQDARALRAGGALAVLYRRANQLRLLLVELEPATAGAASQSAGGW